MLCLFYLRVTAGVFDDLDKLPGMLGDDVGVTFADGFDIDQVGADAESGCSGFDKISRSGERHSAGAIFKFNLIGNTNYTNGCKI